MAATLNAELGRHGFAVTRRDARDQTPSRLSDQADTLISQADAIILFIGDRVFDDLEYLVEANKKASSPIPLLVALPKGALVLGVLALEFGAWDVVFEHVAAQRLAAILRGALRQAAAAAGLEKAPLDSPLTPNEERILSILKERAGSPVRHDELIAYLGDDHSQATLRLLISQLRPKLETHCPNLAILTIRGVGYQATVAD